MDLYSIKNKPEKKKKGKQNESISLFNELFISTVTKISGT